MGFSVRIYNCYDVKGLKTVLVATHHDSRDLGSSKPAQPQRGAVTGYPRRRAAMGCMSEPGPFYTWA